MELFDTASLEVADRGNGIGYDPSWSSPPPTNITPMNQTEAQACLSQVESHLNHSSAHLKRVRVLLLDLDRREGWKALGYASWRECVTDKLGKSASTLYRELKAAEIEIEVSPTGEIGEIAERTLRSLSKLPVQERRSAFEQAGGKAATPKTVESVVASRLEEETPSLEELLTLYSKVAERVEHRPTHKYRNQFAVERTAAPSFSALFLGRKEAHQAWQKKYARFAEKHPLPEAEQMTQPGYPIATPRVQVGDVVGLARDPQEYTISEVISEDVVVVQDRDGQQREAAVADFVLRPIAKAEPKIWYGDRVSGVDLEGNPQSGIVTSMGSKYAQLNNSPKTSVVIETATLLQEGVFAEDDFALSLVGKTEDEQLAACFAEQRFFAAGEIDFSTGSPESDYKGWRVKTGWEDNIITAIAVHKQGRTWQMRLRGDDEGYEEDTAAELVQEAIDFVEEAMASLAAVAEVSPVGEKASHPAGLPASAKSCEHYTPEYLWRPGLECFDVEAFDLDPATYADSPIPCKRIFTKAEDGLKQEWKAATLWLNPPYSDRDPITDKRIVGVMDDWVDKLIEAWRKPVGEGVDAALILVKSDCRPEWFHSLLADCTAYCFVRGAVPFERPKGEAGSGNGSFFGSVIFYFGAEVDRFYHSYSSVGVVGQTLNPELFGA